jgi:hypothetical protein
LLYANFLTATSFPLKTPLQSKMNNLKKLRNNKIYKEDVNM